MAHVWNAGRMAKGLGWRAVRAAMAEVRGRKAEPAASLVDTVELGKENAVTSQPAKAHRDAAMTTAAPGGGTPLLPPPFLQHGAGAGEAVLFCVQTCLRCMLYAVHTHTSTRKRECILTRTNARRPSARSPMS